METLKIAAFRYARGSSEINDAKLVTIFSRRLRECGHCGVGERKNFFVCSRQMIPRIFRWSDFARLNDDLRRRHVDRLDSIDERLDAPVCCRVGRVGGGGGRRCRARRDCANESERDGRRAKQQKPQPHRKLHGRRRRHLNANSKCAFSRSLATRRLHTSGVYTPRTKCRHKKLL